MENNYVAAVDLGTTKVIIAIARRVEKNKVEIVAVKEQASKGVIKGDLRNNEQAYQALSEVKRQIEQEHNITISEVYIGISGQHIKCAKATGNVFVQSSDNAVSEVTAADVKRLSDEMYNSALPAGKSIIAVLPQTYKIDNEPDIIEPVGMEGKRLEAEFNLIMGEIAAIDRIKRCFSRADMNVQGITLQPLASSYAVLSEDEKELGVAVLDIGGGTTDLCIYHDKIIRHIAVLPVGGDEVNRDIKSFGILDRHLEKLKTLYGEAVAERASEQKYITIPSISGQAPKEISVKTLAGIIEARMYDIIDFVAKELEVSGYKNKLGAGIVLTGGGATLKNLDLLFRNQLGCEVRLASPNQCLTPESVEVVGQPRYSTIAGILIDALRNSKFSKIENQAILNPTPAAPEAPAVEQLTAEQQREIALEQQRRAYEANQAAERIENEEYGNNEEEEQPATPPRLHVDEQEYDDDEQYEDEEFYTNERKRGKGPLTRLFGSFRKIFSEDTVDADDDYNDNRR